MGFSRSGITVIVALVILVLFCVANINQIKINLSSGKPLLNEIGLDALLCKTAADSYLSRLKYTSDYQYHWKFTSWRCFINTSTGGDDGNIYDLSTNRSIASCGLINDGGGAVGCSSWIEGTDGTEITLAKFKELEHKYMSGI